MNSAQDIIRHNRLVRKKVFSHFAFFHQSPKCFFDKTSKKLLLRHQKSINDDTLCMNSGMNHEHFIVINSWLLVVRNFFAEFLAISFFVVVRAQCIASVTLSTLPNIKHSSHFFVRFFLHLSFYRRVCVTVFTKQW